MPFSSASILLLWWKCWLDSIVRAPRALPWADLFWPRWGVNTARMNLQVFAVALRQTR